MGEPKQFQGKHRGELIQRILELEQKLAMVEGTSALASVGVDAHAALVTVAKEAEADVELLMQALCFYSAPDSYFAIAFIPDPPCGEFIEDFEDIDGTPRPGKRARAAMKNLRSAIAEFDGLVSVVTMENEIIGAIELSETDEQDPVWNPVYDALRKIKGA